jgi:hypothetical protein
MFKISVIALSLISATLPVFASDDYTGFPRSDPTDDCRACCGNITAAFNYCINQEQMYYDLAKSDWLELSDENRSFCIKLMSRGDPRSYYQGLETCFNMKLREQASKIPQEFHY